MTQRRLHGGTDALGAPLHDFSSCSNACGPCPGALQALQGADASRYPDPGYAGLCAPLAALHGVAPERVLLAGSASEFIFRITSALARRSGRGASVSGQHTANAAGVHLPVHAYGDYAQAARAWGLPLVAHAADAALVWACEPSGPLGHSHLDWPHDLSAQAVVLDAAYAPLRLSGVPSLSTARLDWVWQLYTPNKALGLTGVRAAYVIAPSPLSTRAKKQIESWVEDLDQLAPSWPIGAHGVAMLQAWVSPQVQAWLAQTLPVLRAWKARQVAMLQALGWQVQPSEANFFCARPPQPLDLPALRVMHGIKLRDAASFGLPGWLRLGVLAPQSQDALQVALRQLKTLQCHELPV